MVTSHCHQPPPIASPPPTPLGGPGPLVPLPHGAPALLPPAQPGCSGGRIWGTGTNAGGPAMPAAPGGAGSWHLPPTRPGVGSTPCSLSGQLCWLPTCQVASPVPGWGCWLCPGQGHPLGCQRGRDTWRHLETHSEHLCTFSAARQAQWGVPCACSPCPAPRVLLPIPCFPCLHHIPHALLPVPAPHALLPIPCAPCHPLPCCPGWDTRELWGSGACGDDGQLCVCRGWRAVEALRGEKGCGCPCHVCAIGWGSAGAAWGPGQAVWGQFGAGTGGWVCRGRQLPVPAQGWGIGWGWLGGCRAPLSLFPLSSRASGQGFIFCSCFCRIAQREVSFCWFFF